MIASGVGVVRHDRCPCSCCPASAWTRPPLSCSTLTIVDGAELRGTKLTERPWDEPIPFADMRLHVLAEGWSFDLARRRVEPPEPTLSR